MTYLRWLWRVIHQEVKSFLTLWDVSDGYTVEYRERDK